MARTLPWKKQGTRVAARSSARSAAPSSSPETLVPPSPPSPGKKHVPRHSPRPRTARTTSPQPRAVSMNGQNEPGPTSSPPKPKPMAERQVAAPALPYRWPFVLTLARYMITGLEHDDHWRMVEDEFVAVAHKFTAHLHAEEYQRLKDMATTHDARDARSPSRRVVGKVSNRVKRRQAVLSLQMSQRSSIKRVRSRQRDDDDDDEEDDLPWAGTNLEELMDSPQKRRRSLANMVSAASDTRAAALSRKDRAEAKSIRWHDNMQRTTPPALGRQRSVRFQEDDSEEEGLGNDAATVRPTKSFAPATSSSSTCLPRHPPNTAPGRTVKMPAPTPRLSASITMSASKQPDDDSDSSVDLLFDIASRYNKRRTSRR